MLSIRTLFMHKLFNRILFSCLLFIGVLFIRILFIRILFIRILFICILFDRILLQFINTILNNSGIVTRLSKIYNWGSHQKIIFSRHILFHEQQFVSRQLN